MPKRGESWTAEQKLRLAAAKRGELNPQWKSNGVGYKALHAWVRRNSIIPAGCELCKREVKLEAANKSGKYLRDLSDWNFLCNRCHVASDGRKEMLSNFSKNHERGSNGRFK